MSFIKVEQNDIFVKRGVLFYEEDKRNNVCFIVNCVVGVL